MSVVCVMCMRRARVVLCVCARACVWVIVGEFIKEKTCCRLGCGGRPIKHRLFDHVCPYFSPL